MCTQMYRLQYLQMWLKGMLVGPLAILDKINLKCMLVIMIKDSHLML
jgi:hypothetical protein